MPDPPPRSEPRPAPAKLPGRTVQLDPIKPTLKPAGSKRLKLKYVKLLSTFAFKFNSRRYTPASAAAAAAAGAGVGPVGAAGGAVDGGVATGAPEQEPAAAAVGASARGVV